MKKFLLALGLLVSCTALAAGPSAGNKHAIARGKFLVGYGSCNDCHTPGWAENGGKAPKDMLLTGEGTNFQGPWGTTYPINLRLYFQKITLKEWIHNARTVKARPAMPYWTFRYLSDRDLAAIYAYVRSLGPSGRPAHEWVPPGQPAPAPYLKLVVPAGPPPVAGH